MKTNSGCSLCASNDVYLEECLDAAQIASMWKHYYSIDVSAYLPDDELRLIACRSCGLRFFDQAVVGDGPFYERLQAVPRYYMRRKWEHAEALKDLDGCKSVLEVGCGDGAFLEELEKVGIGACGLELNTKAAAAAGRKGLVVSTESIEVHAASHAGRYDAVCAFQVLEHIANPREFLQALCDALKPDGRLILGVPNRRSYLRLSLNLLDLPPHHASRWDRLVMRNCEKLFPLRMKRCLNEPLADHQRDAFLSGHLDRWITRMPLLERCRPVMWKWAERILRRLHLQPLLTGEMLYVCFGKAE